MRILEISLFAVSILAVVVVFAEEFLRGHGARSFTLPGPMLFALRITLGVVFTILGIIGSLLPVLQGWMFFLLAALLFFPQSRFAVKALQKVEPKMPRLAARLRRWGIGCGPERDTIGTE